MRGVRWGGAGWTISGAKRTRFSVVVNVEDCWSALRVLAERRDLCFNTMVLSRYRASGARVEDNVSVPTGCIEDRVLLVGGCLSSESVSWLVLQDIMQVIVGELNTR